MYAAIRSLGTSTGRAPSPEMKAMLDARQRAQPTRPLTAARLRRIHTTLMSALNTAVKRRLLPLNPASYVELDTGRRPRAVVWTEQREAHWRATGERPKVAVWLPAQTGAFLDKPPEPSTWRCRRPTASRTCCGGSGADHQG